MLRSTFEIPVVQLRSVLEITPPQPYLCEQKPYPAIWFAWRLKVVRRWPQAQPQSDNETVEPRYNEHPYDIHPSLLSVSFSPLPLPPHSSFLLSSQFSRRTRAETLATQATNTPIYLRTEILLPSDFSIPLVTIHYIHHCTSPIIHPVCTPKFSITFVFNEKLKAMLMQNLGAGEGG